MRDSVREQMLRAHTAVGRGRVPERLGKSRRAPATLQEAQNQYYLEPSTEAHRYPPSSCICVCMRACACVCVSACVCTCACVFACLRHATSTQNTHMRTQLARTCKEEQPGGEEHHDHLKGSHGAELGRCSQIVYGCLARTRTTCSGGWGLGLGLGLLSFGGSHGSFMVV